MTTQEMRNAISDAYDGKRWKAKVACMYDDQVIAVYHSFLERGVFDKPKNQPVDKKAPDIVRQLSIFDFVKEDKEKMVHEKIWEKFKEHNGSVSDIVTCWFPNGKNSIRVRLRESGDLIFTYISKKKWRLETVDSYLDSTKVSV
jgi:hypothetical protein